MITVVRYQQITGDFGSTDAEIERCLTDAVALLEEYLDRPLVEAERTEAMRPDRDGRLWPRVTPVLTAAGYEIDGLGLVGAAPFGPAVGFIDPSTSIDVTYTGGWADPTAVGYDPLAANQLPGCVVRDLAFAAHRLAHPTFAAQAAEFPAGATAVRLGDASITFGPQGAQAVPDTTGWWSARTRGYRWAPVHTGPDVARV